jgi:hypothetical protein
MAVALAGSILIFIGFMADLVMTTTLGPDSNYTSYQSYEEAYDLFIGIGAVVTVIGWIIHQRELHHRQYGG